MIPNDFEEVLGSLTESDALCRELRADIEKYEGAVEKIEARLTEEEKDTLDCYVGAILELGKRQTKLAAAHYAVNGCKNEDPA